MPSGSSSAVVRSLETLFRVGSVVAIPDSRLVEQFLQGPTEAADRAFGLLVERHGAMVLRVCRQMLGNGHDAEDAAQATFLVLVRRARSIRRSDSLTSWLYGVACRVSARAKTDVARRRAHEQRCGELTAARVDDVPAPETWPELHEELARLPEKFRLPIVLHHLEGRSYEQTAEQLGCPIRTVHSRLARGRARLKGRLARRGLGAAGTLLATALATDSVVAAVPENWSRTTVQAGIRSATSKTSAASLAVSALAEGVVTSMVRERMLSVAKIMVLIGVAAGGLGVLARSAPAIQNDRGRSYRTTIGKATTIEVVGVSTYPSGPKTWWKPDGSPLDEAPGNIPAMPFDRPDSQVRAVLVRVSGLAAGATFRWLPEPIGDYWGLGLIKNDQRVEGMEVYLGAFPKNSATCAVRLRLSEGPWKTEGSNSGEQAHSTENGRYHVYYGKARPYNGGTAISVAHNISDHDMRLVAVDRNGEEHGAISSTKGDGPLGLLDVEFREPTSEIREYRLQSRPVEKAEIGAISMRPPASARGGQAEREIPVGRALPQQPVKGRDPTTRKSGTRASAPNRQDPDTDGDGLTDFQEIHKYGTDPAKFSTANDGVSDGDWQRRREFTYSVRSVVKVMPPVNLECLNDDYQDARVLSRGGNYVELEVIHYPLNTNADAIRGNADWRKPAQALERHLRPGITTNWDESMRRELTAALKAAGIDPEQLDDKQLVLQAARWLFANSQYRSMFTTHYIDFPDGRPAIYPGCEARFRRDQGEPAWSVQEQLDHDVLGRAMFANRTHGSCTSSAVYLTTALRALGIPTRMVLAIPMVDGNDPDQTTLVRNGIRHHGVRTTALLGTSAAQGYANHTFNEVYVGGRWVRLNYAKLGQNILDASYMGLMTHVNTFDDLSDARLAPTWGKRYALGERDAVFTTGNPYKAESVSDHFGKYAHVANPESTASEHRAITLSRVYWVDSTDAPDPIRQLSRGKRLGGHLAVHGDEWFDDQPYQQYKAFMQAADKAFVLAAKGRPDVHGRITMSYFTQPSANLREMEIVIPPEEYANMESGVEYTLKPRNDVAGYVWKAKGKLTVIKR